MKLGFFCVFLLSFLTEATLASVLAIDYGSDWMKASLMKPGVPFDVLLNKDSKRKIQSTVGWKTTDRLFGSDGFNIMTRYPTDSFSSLKVLQAAPFDSEAVTYYTTISTADIVETARHTVALQRPDGTEWSVEELIAMQFAYVKDLAEAAAGEKVYDVIVTVPPYYTQFERDAVADAIEIAGLRTLGLINDGTAVAVNYAMTRTFAAPEYHVIYDAGASSIKATLVKFLTGVTDAKVAGSSGTHINVLGVGYDRETGGTELDRRLRELLIHDFNTKHKKDIRTNKRGMAKLWKEAGRVKTVLSANSEAVSTVESLAFDIDFKTKISRSAFEEACSDLKGKYAQPITDALTNAGLTLDNITSVILTGGSSRTPMIQQAVRGAVGTEKIALNVNADEAAVLGAALHGASLSRQFKTKDIKVSDIVVHDIQASYFAAPARDNAKPRTINSLVFPKGSKTGTRKTLTFKKKEDFALWVEYKEAAAPGFPRSILEVDITGVADALANLTERGAVDPVVKATLSLSESGFVSVREAIAFAEYKEDTGIAGKLKGLFGGGSSSSSDEETASPEEASTASPETTPTASSDSETASPTPSAEKKLTLKDGNTIQLEVTTKFPTIPPMSAEEKRAARDRLRAIDYEEAAKNRKSEARNNLEGYLYRMRDLLDADNDQTPFMKCSQDTERATISDKVSELLEWLHDKGDIAETSQFLEKRNSLEILEQPIVHRYQEVEAFPQTLNNSQLWNWSSRMFLKEAKENLTAEAAAGQPSKWTLAELEALEKTLHEHEVWLDEWVEKQKSVKMNEDPVIETAEMKARAKALETALMKLVRRKVPKAKKTSTASSTSATGTETVSASAVPTDSETATSTPTPEPSPAEPTDTAGPDIRDEL